METYIALLTYLGIIVLIITSLKGILISAKSTTQTFQMRMATQHAILTGTTYIMDGFDTISDVEYPLYGVNISYMRNEVIITYNNGAPPEEIYYKISPLKGIPI